MQTQTKVIDGISYTTTMLPARQGLAILPKLIALFGEPVLKLMFAADADQRAELIRDPKVMASILHSMAASASDGDGLLVIQDLFNATEADKVRIGDTTVSGNVAVHFDDHFAGKYGHLMNVALWVASVNFLGP